MKKIIPALLFGLFSFSLFAQLISTEPPLPVITQPVVVTFNAAECSGGLAGYDGDVYAHTGLITETSGSGSDWKYVKTNWGVNTPDTKLTRIGQDLYELEISPSIREYYGVPASETVLKMAFVFRSGVQVEGAWLEGKTEAGGDIFVDVYEAGLSVSFSKPLYFPVIVQINESFTVEVNANEADNVSLYIDETLVKSMAGNYLSDTITASAYGKYLVKAVATNDTGVVADSFYYHVRPAVTVETLPAGIRDGINYTGDQTAILSLFAPYKNFIYVIGDFNNWDIDADFFMKKTPDGKRFWLEIDGLTPGQEYVFQYYIDGQIRVGDPYADKISDPWNDEYISEETYPGLIPYPEGKTTGIATVLQTAQTPYAWEV
ncbi:MAG TPA: Por secretion system protein, partial [Bacteroidales bacterium]|nr:Por secretion system protein [Bacteroidales bacterium]